MEDPQRVLIWAAFHVMPKLVGTLMLAGIMAAGLSSASTFLSVIGFSITSDIVFVEFKSEKQQLFVSRVIMLIPRCDFLTVSIYRNRKCPHRYLFCIYDHRSKLGRFRHRKCGK